MASGQALHGFFGLGNVGLHQGIDLLTKARNSLLARFLEGSSDPRSNLVKKRFRTTMQLVAVQAQDIVDLRLKTAQGLLLGQFEPRGKLFKPLGSFARTGQRRFQAIGLCFDRFPELGDLLLGLTRRALCGFTESTLEPLGFLLELRQHRVRVFVKYTNSSLVGARERVIYGTLPTHLCRFGLLGQVVLPSRLCRRQSRSDLLSNFMGRRSE